MRDLLVARREVDSLPGSTMFGFSELASSTTRCLQLGIDLTQDPLRDLGAGAEVVDRSISTSGSTIGVSPASWDSAA